MNDVVFLDIENNLFLLWEDRVKHHNDLPDGNENVSTSLGDDRVEHHNDLLDGNVSDKDGQPTCLILDHTDK